MPSPPKIHLPQTFLMVSTSIEQGMLIPPTPVMNTIIMSCLAHAQREHPVTITDLIGMNTHFHMGLVVEDPLDIAGFMCRFKTESAHAINRALGRSKRTVWCEGYDSPPILSLKKALEKMAYFYLNPAQAGLVASVSDYPGISSWEALKSGEREVITSCPLISRDQIPYLGEKKYSYNSLGRMREELEARSSVSKELSIKPMAWLKCYGDTELSEWDAYRQALIGEVERQEEELKKQRQDEGKGVIGALKLSTQPLDTSYVPTREGRRTWCVAETKEERMAFIDHIKRLLEIGREVVKRWRLGDFSCSFPMGLYPPSFPRRVEPLPYTYQMFETW